MSQIKLMDGSMGHYLLSQGVPKDEKIWSARAIVEEKYHPTVVQGHVDYIRAGATMITTNSYAIQPSFYKEVFEDWESRIPKDVAVSVKLADQARQICGVSADTVRILGSLPPLSQTFRPDLADEYIKNAGEQACVQTYKMLAQTLIQAGVDALIGETLNGWQEAKLVVEATKDLGVPLLLSVEGSCRGNDLQPVPKRAPEVAAQVLKAKKAGAPIEAFSLNCAQPEHILEALGCLQTSGVAAELKAAGVKLAAYANVCDTDHSKEGFDLEKAATIKIETRKDCLSDGYAQWCKKMFSAGLDYCGGCCGTTPAHIKELTEEVALMGAMSQGAPPPPLAPPEFASRRARTVRSAL